MKRIVALIAVCILYCCAVLPACAAEYPSRGLRLIVPFNPGGGGEQAVRLIEKDFREATGQSLSFIYKPGGTGLIGAMDLSRQRPDGYTIGVGSYPLLVVDVISGRAPYTLDSFDFISLLCLADVYLVVRADSPFKTAEELFAQVRENPGRVNLGICEILGPTHIPALQLKKAGLLFNHVPIDGAGRVVPALLGGQVDAALVPGDGASAAMGRMRVLASASEARSAFFPDAPTFRELGFDIVSGVGRYIAAPRGIPAKARAGLENILRSLLERPDVKERYRLAGTVATWKSGDELRAMFEAYAATVRPLIDAYKAEAGGR